MLPYGKLLFVYVISWNVEILQWHFIAKNSKKGNVLGLSKSYARREHDVWCDDHVDLAAFLNSYTAECTCSGSIILKSLRILYPVLFPYLWNGGTALIALDYFWGHCKYSYMIVIFYWRTSQSCPMGNTSEDVYCKILKWNSLFHTLLIRNQFCGVLDSHSG